MAEGLRRHSPGLIGGWRMSARDEGSPSGGQQERLRNELVPPGRR